MYGGYYNWLYYYSGYYNNYYGYPYYMNVLSITPADLPCLTDSSSTTSSSTTALSDVSSSSTTLSDAVVSDVSQLNGRNVWNERILMRMSRRDLQPLSQFSIEVRSQPQTLASGTADPNGAIDVLVALPNDLEPGPHSLITLGIDRSGQPMRFVTNFFVSSDGTLSVGVSGMSSALPATGSNTLEIVIWANFMILSGLGVVLLARNQRRKRLQLPQ